MDVNVLHRVFPFVFFCPQNISSVARVFVLEKHYSNNNNNHWTTLSIARTTTTTIHWGCLRCVCCVCAPCVLCVFCVSCYFLSVCGVVLLLLLLVSLWIHYTPAWLLFYTLSLSGSWNSLGSFLFIRRHYYGQFVCNNLPIFLIHPKVKKKQDTKCLELAILNLSVNRRKSVCWKSLNVFVMWTWNGIEVKILNFVGFSEKARNRREKSGLEKEILFFCRYASLELRHWESWCRRKPKQNICRPISLYYHRINSMAYISPSSICDAVSSLSVLLFHRLSIFNSQRNFLRKLLRSILQKVLKV